MPWLGGGNAHVYSRIMRNDAIESRASKQASNRVNSSYSTVTSQSLSYREKEIIKSLQKTWPELLSSARKEGYSDKEIASYMIEQIDSEEE